MWKAKKNRVILPDNFDNSIYYSLCLYCVPSAYQGFPGSSDGKKVYLQCRRPQLDSWVGKISWRRDRLPIPVFLGISGGSACKESACNAGDLGSVPGLRRSPGVGNDNLLQYYCVENSMGRGAWQATVHGVVKSQTRLND